MIVVSVSIKKSWFRIAMAIFLATITTPARTIHMGGDFKLKNFARAAEQAKPGDTILVHPGKYSGNQVVENLQGTKKAWIYVIGVNRKDVVFEGGVGAWILVDPAYLEIRNLTFTRQTHNGLNVHDGDSYETPGHHLRFIDCSFREMEGNGNFDFLKLSGIDNFEVISCSFVNGAMGSGIDMVGCHKGIVRGCTFHNLPGGGVQAKGGSADIRIEYNRLVDCGIRAVNAGGSTDLEYFRPKNATSQASRIHIIGNIFSGGTSAVCFAGAVQSRAVNNTIVNPTSFVVRILQEQTENGRFDLCGDNGFHNNLVYLDRIHWEEVNVGPETRPKSFSFSHNLWFTNQKPSRRPNLPCTEVSGIYGKNPKLINIAGSDFRIPDTSPAAGAGRVHSDVRRDIRGNPYAAPPSIGAYETCGIPDSEVEMSAYTPSRAFRLRMEYYVTLFGYYLKRTLKFFISLIGLT